MPKTFYKRKRYTRRKRFYKRRANPGAFRRRVRYAVQSFAEKKVHTVKHNDASIDWDGVVYPLNAIAQGDDAFTRTGNQIQVTAVYHTLIAKNKHTSDAGTMTMMLIQDKQVVSDSVPAVTDILHDVGDSSAPMSPLNHSNAGRYSVLWRRSFNVGDQNSGLDHYVTRNWKRTRLNVRYNGTASSDYQKNSLYLLVITDRDSAAAEKFTIRGFTRVYFTDL